MTAALRKKRTITQMLCSFSPWNRKTNTLGEKIARDRLDARKDNLKNGA